MKYDALGMIETKGLIGSIEARMAMSRPPSSPDRPKSTSAGGLVSR